MADTYTIQFRRGMYADFDTSKIRPGEPVAILGNDPSVPSGKALYIAFAANDVRRLCSIEDISEMVNAGEFVGPQGPKGEKGDKGDPGEKGADGTVAFESLTPEQKESLRGISIKSASVDTDGNLTIMFSDGYSEDVGNIMGPQGIQGPKGDKGDVGPQGLKGDKGDVGPKGDNMSDEQAQQIEQNKTDIASLKTETGSLKADLSTKITKFYASSQGETHLADSDNGKIMDMMVYGKSEQKQYSGKNLLNAAFKTYTYSGVTLTNNGDGTYTIEGTNNSSGELIFSLVRTVDEQKALYNSLIGKNVKFIVESGSTISGSVGRICFVFYNKTENRFSNETYNGGNVTVPTGYDSSVIDIHINVGQTVPKTILKPMIVDASLYPDATYDTFEPYTGGIPSPNPDYPQEIKSVVNPTVKVCGKNLLKATLQTATVNGVTCTNNGDGTYTLNGTASGGNPSFRIGKIIAKSGRKLVGSPGAAGSYVRYLPNGTWNNVTEEKGDGSIISNIGKGTDEIAIVVLNGTTVKNLLFKPMLTTDLTATYDDFEPYHEQTVTLPYTLNAIPVSSGGNVTIDGQQYIADYVDVERGKLVRMVGECIISDMNQITRITTNTFFVYGIDNPFVINDGNDDIARLQTNKYQGVAAMNRANNKYFYRCWMSTHDNNKPIAFHSNTDDLSTFKNEVYGTKILYQLATPVEIDLAPEEIKAFKVLATYYPTTNISVNSEQLDGYTVFNYPISMANGWNYVKQQLNDNRDYIYDMDLQSAEAYVNSEYAVALTELEV